MSKKDKLYDKLCSKPRPSGIKFRDVKTLLETNGFIYEPNRGKGGHHFFIHPDGDTPIVIAEKNSTIKPQYINDVCQKIKERNHE